MNWRAGPAKTGLSRPVNRARKACQKKKRTGHTQAFGGELCFNPPTRRVRSKIDASGGDASMMYRRGSQTMAWTIYHGVGCLLGHRIPPLSDASSRKWRNVTHLWYNGTRSTAILSHCGSYPLPQTKKLYFTYYAVSQPVDHVRLFAQNYGKIYIYILPMSHSVRLAPSEKVSRALPTSVSATTTYSVSTSLRSLKIPAGRVVRAMSCKLLRMSRVRTTDGTETTGQPTKHLLPVHMIKLCNDLEVRHIQNTTEPVCCCYLALPDMEW